MQTISNFPLFPLNIVVFPGEELNLHIFEPRYRALIRYAEREGFSFGIPSYVHQKLGYGTEVSLVEISHIYEDGKMDVKTIAKRVFKVQDYVNPLPGKLYAGGTVTFVPLIEDGEARQKEMLAKQLKELFGLLSIPNVKFDTKHFNSFTFAHKIGLSLSQEYELLKLEKESDRLDLINQHLAVALPILREMEQAKEKIKLNGHFKHLDPLSFQ